MNVRSILEAWLKEHGYDGLCDYGCGCLIGDLAPCSCGIGNCVPGHRVEIDADCECECGGSGTKHWHVQSEVKP